MANILIGSDHGGYNLKREITASIEQDVDKLEPSHTAVEIIK